MYVCICIYVCIYTNFPCEERERERESDAISEVAVPYRRSTLKLEHVTHVPLVFWFPNKRCVHEGSFLTRAVANWSAASKHGRREPGGVRCVYRTEH